LANLNINIIILFSTFFLYQCANNEKSINLIKPIKTIDYFSDSTFFGGSECIINYKTNLFIAEDSRILVVDTNLTLIRSFSKPGSGPGEFSKVYRIVIFKDSLFAVDEMAQRMHVFKLNGEYKRTFSLPVSAQGRIAVDNKGRFYFSTNYARHPIVCVNSHGKVVDIFGKMFQGKTDNLSRRKTILNLHIYRNKLLAVNKSEAIIQLYSLDNRNLIKEDNIIIDDLNEFKNEIRYKIKILSESKNTYISILSCSYINDDYLFFSIVERNDVGPSISKIIKYNLKNFSISNIYDINNSKNTTNENWITSICVIGSSLYLSNAVTQNLMKFSIE